MATTIATVGPTMMTKASSRPASPILMLLSTFTPPSRPRTTEISAIAVTPMMIATWVAMPSSMPNRNLKPLAACWAPKPSEVARPKIVASTASVSTRCPNQPQERSFISG
jgi:hypothetical protein